MVKFASTVWLLDDDPLVLKATGRLLASAGWQVKTFTDPDDFLHHAETYRPRVAVIDMWMPRMHGLEVQRRLSEVSTFDQGHCPDCKRRSSRALESVGGGCGRFFH